MKNRVYDSLNFLETHIHIDKILTQSIINNKDHYNTKIKELLKTYHPDSHAQDTSANQEKYTEITQHLHTIKDKYSIVFVYYSLFTFELENDVLCITDINKIPYNTTNIDIPDDVQIIRGCFNNEKEPLPNANSIKKLTFPPSIQIIAGFAFRGWNGLFEIDLSRIETTPDNPLKIDHMAFTPNQYDLSILFDIKLPKYTQLEVKEHPNKWGYYIPFYKTAWSTSITEITVTQLDNHTYIVINNSYIELRREVDGAALSLLFPNLERVYLKNITEIPRAYFAGCKNLQEIIGLENIKVVESEAFFSCPSLKRLTFSNKIKQIGSDAFGYYKIGQTNGALPHYECSPPKMIISIPEQCLQVIKKSQFYNSSYDEMIRLCPQIK